MKEFGRSSTLQFEIRQHCYIDADGKPLGELPEFAQQFDQLRNLLEVMHRVRAFDKRAIALQRTGQMGTYASCYGQEAIGAAIGALLQPDDVLLPTYRETPAMLMRGATMTDLLLYWGGDERGMNWKNCRGDFPICIPIATQCTHACGVAFALKYRQQPQVALCTIGDGGTSKGDFYEAINLAGVWKLPLCMVVVNNQWAISVPRSAQSGAETMAQKAIAAGVASEVVDGNDLIAFHHRLSLALERVRAGEPYVLEAHTYRLGDHTTADDASRYRSGEELAQQLKADPILRLEKYLESRGAWSPQESIRCREACERQVEEAVSAYLSTPPEPPAAIFHYLYESLPDAYAWQRLQAMGGDKGCG